MENHTPTPLLTIVAAMAERRVITVSDHTGRSYNGFIQGVRIEDGSGNNYLVTVRDAIARGPHGTAEVFIRYK